MAILAIDTCLGAASVAVLSRGHDGEQRITECAEDMDSGHAERIVPMLGQVLRDSKTSIADLDRIAVTTGPGSFTGVRTGIAMARALRLSTRCPVVGATSLAVMASEVFANRPDLRCVLVAVDARRGEIYVQLVQNDGRTPGSDAKILTAVAAVDLLPVSGCLIVGSGAQLVGAAAQSLGIAAEVDPTPLQPRAARLAELAERLPILDPVSPLYLRAPDAKPQTANILPRA